MISRKTRVARDTGVPFFNTPKAPTKMVAAGPWEQHSMKTLPQHIASTLQIQDRSNVRRLHEHVPDDTALGPQVGEATTWYLPKESGPRWKRSARVGNFLFICGRGAGGISTRVYFRPFDFLTPMSHTLVRQFSAKVEHAEDPYLVTKNTTGTTLNQAQCGAHNLQQRPRTHAVEFTTGIAGSVATPRVPPITCLQQNFAEWCLTPWNWKWLEVTLRTQGVAG